MKTIKFTYVDSVTQVSIEKAPAKNGPYFPKIKGLSYSFALERKYPTLIPEFIGTCDDDADLTIDGFLKEISPEELEFEQQAEEEARIIKAQQYEELALSGNGD